MLDYLNQLDHRLFLAIHHWRNGLLDEVMPWVTNRWVWIPLYALLLVFVWRRFGKQTIMIALTVAALILASDQSANLLKNNVCRPRPCYDAQLAGQVITPLGCGGNYGFVSGHAANSFAIALFLWLLSGPQKGFPVTRRRGWWLLLFPWMIIVWWSRIYVGVHFPFDVICGGLIGAAWAVVIYILYRKVVPVLR